MSQAEDLVFGSFDYCGEGRAQGSPMSHGDDGVGSWRVCEELDCFAKVESRGGEGKE